MRNILSGKKDATEQINKYKALLNSGAITEEEYRTKISKILGFSTDNSETTTFDDNGTKLGTSRKISSRVVAIVMALVILVAGAFVVTKFVIGPISQQREIADLEQKIELTKDELRQARDELADIDTDLMYYDNMRYPSAYDKERRLEIAKTRVSVNLRVRSLEEMVEVYEDELYRLMTQD